MKEMTSRFWSKVACRGGCWEWTASLRRGYGRFSIGYRTFPAHRVAYEMLVGPIPDGLTLDHLCRNKVCVNPAHLEPVTGVENTQRGPSGEFNREKTHCFRGHPFDDENTRWGRTPVGSGWGRWCRACQREYQREYRQRRLACWR